MIVVLQLLGVFSLLSICAVGGGTAVLPEMKVRAGRCGCVAVDVNAHAGARTEARRSAIERLHDAIR